MYLHNTNTSISENQVPFQPTWLYIKQHNKTGLKYLGKTTKNPLTYPGSGLHWKRHLKKHGHDVSTPWCRLYTDRESLVTEALNLSDLHNVVKSKEWANMKPENGLDGNVVGNKHSAKTCKKMKLSAKKPKSMLWRKSASKLRKGNGNPNFGKKMTEKSRMLQKQNQPSSAGANNGKALCWTVISPTNEIFYLNGNLETFCKQHNLSASGMWVIANTGILSAKGKNVGWQIHRHKPASFNTSLRNSASAK